MILFKPEHVAMILEGRKTQTRRLGRKRWKLAAVHQAKTSLFGEPFARLLILDVRRQKLRHISDEDVKREGYETREEYLGAFRRINGDEYDDHAATVWVVDFELWPGDVIEGRR